VVFSISSPDDIVITPEVLVEIIRTVLVVPEDELVSFVYRVNISDLTVPVSADDILA